MPAAHTKKSHRKASTGTKNVKLPEAAQLALRKADNVPARQGKGSSFSKAAEDIADQLMASPWQTYLARPRADLTGFYLIAKWFPKFEQWAVLYVGRGRVQQRLNVHFSGRRVTPVEHYLASFSKAACTQLWLKWLPEPHPSKAVDLEEVIVAIQHLYNKGERPAFNYADTSSPQRSSRAYIPDDFSILDYA